MPPKAPPYLSVFAILKPAIGPSSSHTLGPLLCARDFRKDLAALRGARVSVRVELYGSLCATGRGHLTDLAVTAGLAGDCPEEGGTPTLEDAKARVATAGGIEIAGRRIAFDPERSIAWRVRTPKWAPHPNTLRFVAVAGRKQITADYVSLGAGFIERLGRKPRAPRPKAPVPHPYHTMEDLLAHARRTGFPISHLILANEAAFHGVTGAEILVRLEQIWSLMNAAIERGLAREGHLPGHLGVKRRAKRVWRESRRRAGHPEGLLAPALAADAYAFAVSEENAAGGAIVTAPTAGSAGVLPAVLKMLERNLTLPERTVARSLLTAGAVAVVIKNLASLSGAEVGCQGEVGSAAAMAAAAAAELAGATPPQVETAAEIAMEHHLGMTCDPVAGLVQIPCIERNAMGAVKALNAAAMSFAGTGQHLISFDAAVRAMWRTGQDLRTAYRETARGGLAAEIV